MKWSQTAATTRRADDARRRDEKLAEWSDTLRYAAARWPTRWPDGMQRSAHDLLASDIGVAAWRPGPGQGDASMQHCPLFLKNPRNSYQVDLSYLGLGADRCLLGEACPDRGISHQPIRSRPQTLSTSTVSMSCRPQRVQVRRWHSAKPPLIRRCFPMQLRWFVGGS